MENNFNTSKAIYEFIGSYIIVMIILIALLAIYLHYLNLDKRNNNSDKMIINSSMELVDLGTLSPGDVFIFEGNKLVLIYRSKEEINGAITALCLDNKDFLYDKGTTVFFNQLKDREYDKVQLVNINML